MHGVIANVNHVRGTQGQSLQRLARRLDDEIGIGEKNHVNNASSGTLSRVRRRRRRLHRRGGNRQQSRSAAHVDIVPSGASPSRCGLTRTIIIGASPAGNASRACGGRHHELPVVPASSSLSQECPCRTIFSTTQSLPSYVDTASSPSCSKRPNRMRRSVKLRRPSCSPRGYFPTCTR